MTGNIPFYVAILTGAGSPLSPNQLLACRNILDEKVVELGFAITRPEWPLHPPVTPGVDPQLMTKRPKDNSIGIGSTRESLYLPSVGKLCGAVDTGELPGTGTHMMLQAVVKVPGSRDSLLLKAPGVSFCHLGFCHRRFDFVEYLFLKHTPVGLIISVITT